MKINNLAFKDKEWEILDGQKLLKDSVDIVFVFGHIDILKKYNHTQLLKNMYPDAHIIGCSTAGNILDATVDEYEVVASAVSFEKGYIKVFSTQLSENKITENTSALINPIDKEDLKHLFVLAPGLINGSDVVNSIKLDKNITVSGALSGDEYKFEDTYLFTDKYTGDDLLIVVGFYGEAIYTSVGCDTGWDEFGATRIVTKSKGNIIYEIDHKPAIELYKKYLGDKINDLPNSALRFPLSIKDNVDDINEVILVMMGMNLDGSLIYGGDIKEGSTVKLMKTNVSNLLDGASLSAKGIKEHNKKASLSIAISCAARRSVLKQYCTEEVAVTKDILPLNTNIIGFYSYGEIAPFSNQLSKPLLHNQTMTITTIYED